MHRCVIDRLPGCIPLGVRVAIEVATPDRGERTPEIVVILCIEHRHERIVSGDSDQSHEASAINEIELLGGGQLTHHWVIDDGSAAEPEARVLRLPRRALSATAAA